VSGLQSLLDGAVASGVFPSAQTCVFREGKLHFEGTAGDARADSVYDLASLTKILSTTTLFVKAWAQNSVSPELLVSKVLPELAPSAHGLTFEDLLFHRAGYAASVPLWAEALRQHPALKDATAPESLRQSVRAHVLGEALRVQPIRPRAEAAVYCDVGFMVLAAALERISGLSIDALFQRELAQPFGLQLSYRRLSSRLPATDVQPTGKTRPRELAPEQPAPPGPEVPKVATRVGEVDDDNAFVLDGVSGHAGLFGTARAVAQTGQLYLEELSGAARIAPADLWRRMFRKDPSVKGSTRALGFDTPSEQGASAGTVFGRSGPLGAVGHLGFTGTSLWVDLDRQWVAALLSNRTYFGRHVTLIREFRPRFHDQVADELRGMNAHGG
jgi:serine-type D-Ala-D-Ala carboxypeptidase